MGFGIDLGLRMGSGFQTGERIGILEKVRVGSSDSGGLVWIWYLVLRIWERWGKGRKSKFPNDVERRGSIAIIPIGSSL